MATPFKILVIDDNPMIRELIGQGLESFGEVQLFADGADALRELETATPDLAIVDAELGVKGDPSLLEKLRQRLTTPLILLSSRDINDESHRTLNESADEVIEKPFLIRDLQSRVRRIVERLNLERMTRSAGGDSVRGTLAQMSITDLVQSLEIGRKSCCLVLSGAPSSRGKSAFASGGQQRCEMYFVEGQLVHAACGWLLGDEAVFDALRWEGEGTFEIDFKATTALHTTTRSTQALLMEGMRLLDEAKRDASENDDGQDESNTTRAE